MLASASLETPGEGGGKKANSVCHSGITSREEGILIF
jgi:hypothetical protein